MTRLYPVTKNRGKQPAKSPHHSKRKLLAVLSATLLSGGPLLNVALLAYSPAASAQEQARSRYAIAAQPLRDALLAFSKQSGLQVIIATEAVKQYTSAPVQGEMTRTQALDRLLNGAPLDYVFSGEVTVTISEKNAATRPAREAPESAPAESAAEAPKRAEVAAEIAEVIVTAQKHEENMQVVPLAISAMTGEDMANKGITSFEGVARATPSISFQPYPISSTTLVLYMRGQGFADPGQLTNDGAVGFYEDGFYISRPQGATFDLADVERVEVLRGPQGTLYGRNTTGGAVNLISKAPTGEFGFKQSFTFGSRDLFRSLTAIDLPRLGNVSTKISLLKSSVDGYVKNAGSGHDFGEQAQQAGRFLLHWDAADAFAVDYFMETGSLDSTPLYFQRPELNGKTLYPGIPYHAKEDGLQTHSYRPVDLPLSTSNFEGHGLTLSWDVSDALTIKSLTGYRKLSFHGYQDFVEVQGYPYASDDLYKTHQFSQELQFIGDALDGSINYVGGLYYFEEGGSHEASATLVSFHQQTYRHVGAQSKSKAAFGQLTWTPPVLDEKLQFTVGARYTQDDKSAQRTMGDNVNGISDDGARNGAVNSQSFSRFNPTFTVNYQWTDEISSYAKVATGYKAGGSLETAPPGEFNHTFGPENLTSYEVGLKSYWFDRHMRLNLAAFDSRIEDLQLMLGADPNSPARYQAYNAGRATIKGLEASVLVVPVEDLSLNLDYTWLNAGFDKVDVIPGTVLDHNTNPLSPYQVGDNVKNLFAMPLAPKHSLSLSGDYTFLRFDSGSLSAHLDYRWQSQQYQFPGSGPDVPNRDLVSVPSYGVVNGRLNLALDLPRGDHAKIGIWAKNLGRKTYPQLISSGGGTVVPLPGRGAGYVAYAPAWSEPPSYGIDVVYEY